MTSMHGFGLGIASKNTSGEILEVFYPQPLAHLSGAVASAIEGVSGELDDTSLAQLANALDQAGESGLAQIARQLINCQETVVATALTENAPPRDVSEAYLKLHLLSHRLVQPHGTQLEGIFPLLPNIAWTNQGAIDLRELPQRQLDARLRGEVIEVASVDKFPKMTNYVVPAGVRIPIQPGSDWALILVKVQPSCTRVLLTSTRAPRVQEWSKAVSPPESGSARARI